MGRTKQTPKKKNNKAATANTNISVVPKNLNPNLADEEKWTICPYHPNHRILKEKFITHVARCPDKKDNFKTCPHNPMHIIKDTEYDSHLATCPSKQPTATQEKPPIVQPITSTKIATTSTTNASTSTAITTVGDPNKIIGEDNRGFIPKENTHFVHIIRRKAEAYFDIYDNNNDNNDNVAVATTSTGGNHHSKHDGHSRRV